MHVYNHSKYLKKFFIVALTLVKMLFFNWDCWLRLPLNHLPQTFHPAFFDNGKTHVCKVCFVSERLKEWIFGLPRCAECICKAENMQSKQEPKRGSEKRSQRTSYGGLGQRGWTENSGLPNYYNYSVPNVTPWATLSFGEDLKRSSLTGSTLLSAPWRRPKSSNLLLWVQRDLLAQASLANLCCST